jgi:hypothetical protein
MHIADRIVEAFTNVKAERLDVEDRDAALWSDGDTYRAFMAQLRTARCWKVSDRRVAASISPRGCGESAASEMLDRAADVADTEGITFATGLIEQPKRGVYTLSW